MRSTTKATIVLYCWYAVCVLGIGTWALITFRSYDYNGSGSLNWKTFAIGAGVGAALGFPFLVISWGLNRILTTQERQRQRQRERQRQRQHDTARYDLMHAKVDALLVATGAQLSESIEGVAPGGNSFDRAEPYAGDDSSSAPEVTTVGLSSPEVAAPTRSPYEPPQSH